MRGYSVSWIAFYNHMLKFKDEMTGLESMNIRDIEKLASSDKTFDKGKAYFLTNKVKITEKYRDEDDEMECYCASVEGSKSEEYVVTLDLNRDGKIIDYSCNCPAAENYPGACKHAVATLFKVWALNENSAIASLVDTAGDSYKSSPKSKRSGLKGSPSPARTLSKPLSDRNTQRLIDLYAARNILALQSETTADEKVKLIPKLTVGRNDVELSLTVGNAKMYVIKNIKNFCESMQNGEEVEYGKELTLLHHPSLFDEESQVLLSYVLDRYEEIESYKGQGYYDVNFGYDKTKRYMRLGQGNIDLLLSIMKGNCLQIEGVESVGYPAYKSRESSNNEKWKEKRERSYRVIEYTPKIDVEIERKETGEYNIKGQTYDYILGKNHLYLSHGDELWCCDKEFSSQMKEFIEILHAGQGTLNVVENDMAELCANVIPQIQGHVNMQGSEDILNDFMPAQAVIKIYLDSPSKDTVTAKVHCEYEEGILFDVMTEQQTFHDSGVILGQAASVAQAGKIIRDRLLENKAKISVCKYFDGYDQKSGLLYFAGEDERIYNFVNTAAQEFTKIGEVFTTEKYRRIGNATSPKLSVGVKLESELLKIDFDLEQFDIPDLMEALRQYKQKKKYYRLKNGSFIDLNEEGFRELLHFVDEFGLTKADLEKGQVNMPKYRALLLNSALKNAATIKFERDGHFKSLIRGMNAIEDSDYEIPAVLVSVLRDYQKDGFRWLKTMSSYGFCGILADEMGLGKTLQIIALLEDARCNRKNELPEIHMDQTATSLKRFAIVVCPASLVLNWEKEIMRFAPELSTITVIGTSQERKKRIHSISDLDVIITSYDLLRRDLEHYQNCSFDYCILDEAQYIKNQSTQNARAVKMINSTHRFALTGTPIENRLSELWSIFDFLIPHYLSSYNKFKADYETAIVREKDLRTTERLKRQVSPFMLRRLKKNVLKELPEKNETVIYAKLEGEQERLYKANLAKAKTEISKEVAEGALQSNKLTVLALLMRLRQICCHPSLCYENYTKGSSKLEACLELVEEALSGGHKILVFSQFTSMLEILEAELKKVNIDYYKLTGSTSKEKRAEMVEQFNQEDEEGVSVFLISLKAGGTGLNLAAADVVIHYDPWWNVAAQNQATDRAHRIGQKKHVQVYKIIAEDSIEEKILKLQESKKDLADVIITENEALISRMTGKDLLELLS
ncbi:DEAD/DEAH box helicase [Clostridium aminobutyricum]|uniref:SNF2 helicase associated domain-containing protein n=1 Tax=Clostridium aminobutyricum TaxID=33953 RepID=A0A939IFX6_CLOAM|nr:DEAD/DEAH box helicase [Clostridium aminobutyricum]MBN7772090.1 SNF2 helicase associated domain-containing protein [Clostridium aminobutyricum]